MKKLRLGSIFLAILLFAAMGFVVVGAQSANLKLPNPTPEFYSNDFANVLDSGTESDIVKLGEGTFKSTGGGQVVFVSIDSLNGSTIEEYSNALFNKWKIGTKDKGVLFILSMKERKSRIEVGYGYEGVLTDIQSNKLLVKFSELNKEKGIDEAVETIYSDIVSIVSGDGDTVQYPDTGETRQKADIGSSFFRDNPIATDILVVVILVLVIVDFVLTGGQVTFFILRMAASSARRGGGGGRNSGGGGRSGGGGSSSGF
ncbi:MAG: TPM domain-containing protein [Caulobacteraceae bacterium]